MRALSLRTMKRCGVMAFFSSISTDARTYGTSYQLSDRQRTPSTARRATFRRQPFHDQNGPRRRSSCEQRDFRTRDEGRTWTAVLREDRARRANALPWVCSCVACISLALCGDGCADARCERVRSLPVEPPVVPLPLEFAPRKRARADPFTIPALRGPSTLLQPTAMPVLHDAVKKGKASDVLRELTAGADVEEQDKVLAQYTEKAK